MKASDTAQAARLLSMAVYHMAVRSGDIKERLYHAFLQLLHVSERQLPPEFHEELRWIKKSLTSKEPTQSYLIHGKRETEGRINATLRTMRIAKAEEIARRIYELADKVQQFEAAA
jgi:hypothetical protein